MITLAVFQPNSPAIPVLKIKLWIYWSELNSWIHFYIVLNTNWKLYCSKQSFSGLVPKDQCSSWGLSFQLILSIIFFTKIMLKLDTNYGLFFQLSMKICPLNNSCVKQNKKNLNYLYLQTDTFLQQLLDKHNMCHVETWHFAIFFKTLYTKLGSYIIRHFC